MAAVRTTGGHGRLGRLRPGGPPAQDAARRAGRPLGGGDHLGHGPVHSVPPGRHRRAAGVQAAPLPDRGRGRASSWSPPGKGIESTRYAFRVYKRLFYLTKEHEEEFLPEVTKALEAFEAGLIAEQPTVERTALKLYESGEPELARKYLTYYSNTEAMNGLRLAEALAASIEARTKVQFGIRPPSVPPDKSK